MSVGGAAATDRASEVVLQAAALEAVVRAIVVRGGSDALEASRVARNLVLANESGHDSHGVGMVPRYVDALLEGGLAVNQHARVELDTGALLRIDGCRGYGQVIGHEAMELGIERALERGVCVVALANSHHLGRIGHWAEQCVVRGLVSIHFVNVVARPIVAAFGGLDARTGTNPVCVAVPRRDSEPLILDFATSRIAQGKARIAHHRGEPLPPGNVLDDGGEPTTDARFAVTPPFGAILPFGEHKGFGLGVMAELLGGALTGSGTGHALSGARRIINGMLSVLIDPHRLGTAEAFSGEMEAYLEWLGRSRVPDGAGPITLPGMPERAARARARASGISLDRTTWCEILTAGEKLGAVRDELEALAQARS